MKILKLVAAASLVTCALTACGGGGGSATIPITTDTTTAASTTLSGIASKGPFTKDSVVKVYGVTNGVKGALIKQTTVTDDNGSYSADLGSYTGPIMVEVSGSYQDEATGHTVPVAESAPLRAALPAVQGAVTLPVTPLTELAVAKTGGTLTPAAITAANTMVSQVFKVDIVGTMPVPPTSAALSHVTDQRVIDYTMALAAISQMASSAAGASDSDKILSVMSTLGQGISTGSMTSGTSAAFQGALNNFVMTNPMNQTGVKDTSGSGLMTVGTPTKSYTLSLEGNSAAAAGIQFDLAIPAGVTVSVQTLESGMLSGSLMMGSTLSNALVAANYASGALSVGIISTEGISAGKFATLTCNIPSGTTAPAASDFVVSKVLVLDGAENVITAAKVTVN